MESVDAEEGVPELFLAHEFLDALPVHQLVHTPRGWRERMIDLREFSEEALTSGGAPTDGSESESGSESGSGSGSAGSAASAAASPTNAFE